MSSSVNTIGFKEYQSKLKSAPDNIKKMAGLEVKATAEDWAALAIRAARKDKGNLVKFISYKHFPGRSEVYSGARYSPYVEWGTGTKVSVPSDLQSYALQFKGHKQVIGMSPRPFFFIHKKPMQEMLVKRIQNLLKGL